MATPFLAVNYRSGTPKVKRYANATPGDPVIGEVTFGVVETGAGDLHACSRNRVVQYREVRTWHCLIGSSVYKTTDGGLSWAGTALTGAAANMTKSGIHIIDLGGVPTMVMMWGTSANLWRGATNSTGSSWATSGTFSASTALLQVTDEVVFNNVIYVLMGTTSAVASLLIFFNPATSSGGSNTFGAPAVASQPHCFAPYRNSLYVVRRNTTNIYLVDVTYGTGIDVVVLWAGTPAVAVTGARYASFVDDATGDLICFIYTTTALGWKVMSVSPTFTVTEITASVIPVALTGTTGGGSSPASSRLQVLVDQEGSPGATPVVYVFYGADGTTGTPMNMFQWNGVASTMTLVDSGGNAADALGINYDMDGGQYSWSAGEKTMTIVSRVAAVGGVRFTFKLHSDSGTDVMKVRAFTRREVALQSRTKTPAEVENNSHGALSGAAPGNYNTGLTADGTTSYQLTVNLIDLGFSLVERGRIIFDVVDDV